MKEAMIRTATRRMRVRVGDVLRGEAGGTFATIRITYIVGHSYGFPLIVAERLPDGHEDTWTLSCRDWRKLK